MLYWWPNLGHCDHALTHSHSPHSRSHLRPPRRTCMQQSLAAWHLLPLSSPRSRSLSRRRASRPPARLRARSVTSARPPVRVLLPNVQLCGDASPLHYPTSARRGTERGSARGRGPPSRGGAPAAPAPLPPIPPLRRIPRCAPGRHCAASPAAPPAVTVPIPSLRPGRRSAHSPPAPPIPPLRPFPRWADSYQTPHFSAGFIAAAGLHANASAKSG